MGKSRNEKKKSTEYYLDIEKLYINYCKVNFITIEEFFKLRLFDIFIAVQVYNEKQKDVAIWHEMTANYVMSTGMNRPKNLEWIDFFEKDKSKKLKKIDEFNLELMQGYSDLYS